MIYPSYDTIPYNNPSTEQLEFKTLTTNFAGGEEKRRRQWVFPKRNITLVYDNISKTNARVIYDFYKDCYGSYSSFNFFTYGSADYADEYIGTGNGSTTIYNLPCKTSSSRTVYVNNISQIEGVDYTFSALGGTDGADKITFTTAPTDGHYIKLDFTGVLKIHCRFKDDVMDFETMYNRLTTVGVNLKGLLNE